MPWSPSRSEAHRQVRPGFRRVRGRALLVLAKEPAEVPDDLDGRRVGRGETGRPGHPDADRLAQRRLKAGRRERHGLAARLVRSIPVEVPLVGEVSFVGLGPGRAQLDRGSLDHLVRAARVDGRAAGQHKADDHRIVICRPVRVGRIERHDVTGRLEVRVVVEDRRLVRVDVPFGDIDYLGEERLVRKRVVEISGLAVEDERVGVLTDVLRDQVRVAGAVMASIGSSFAYELRSPMIRFIAVALAGRVVGEPVDERLGRERAGDVAVALAVAGIGIADVLQSEPFDFRWFAATVKRAPVALRSNVCATTGRLSVSMNRGSTRCVRIACVADRRHDSGLVEDRDPDRVSPDDAGVDVGVRAGRRPR